MVDRQYIQIVLVQEHKTSYLLVFIGVFFTYYASVTVYIIYTLLRLSERCWSVLRFLPSSFYIITKLKLLFIIYVSALKFS